MASTTAPVNVMGLHSSEALQQAGLQVLKPHVVSAEHDADFTILAPIDAAHPTTWLPLRVGRAYTSQASALLMHSYLDTLFVANDELVLHHPFASAGRVMSLLRLMYRLVPLSRLLTTTAEAYKLAVLAEHFGPSNSPDNILSEVLTACATHVVDGLTPRGAMDLWSEVALHGTDSWRTFLARYFARNDDAMALAAAEFDHDALLALLQEPHLDCDEDVLVSLVLTWIDKHRPRYANEHELIDWLFDVKLTKEIAWHRVSESCIWDTVNAGVTTLEEAGEICQLRYRLQHGGLSLDEAHLFGKPLPRRLGTLAADASLIARHR